MKRKIFWLILGIISTISFFASIVLLGIIYLFAEIVSNFSMDGNYSKIQMNDFKIVFISLGAFAFLSIFLSIFSYIKHFH
jgi:hypothetical protein